MKPIAVEAKKSFAHGFILTEAEFRRLINLLETQFEKLGLEEPLSRIFFLKFKNGVIAETPDIDQVLTQENSGSEKIIRLGVKYKCPGENSSTVANLEFINADEDEESGYTSIRYTLRAEDRDWVFVTSSLLVERIEKIKRFAPNQLGAKGGSRSIYRLFAPIVMLVAMIVFISLFIKLSQVAKVNNPLSEILQKKLEAGTLNDPIVAMIEIQRYEELRRSALNPEDIFMQPLLLIGIISGIVIFIMIVAVFMIRFYPVYNFVWGDYTQEFKRVEGIRKFWIIVIGVGIIVSCIGGLIANRLSLF